MRPPARLFLAAAVAYGSDRLTKSWAERYLKDGPIEVVPGVFRLNLTTNTGGAFGILEGVPVLFAVAAVIVAAVIVWNAGKVRRPWTAVALGLVLGGALGNLTDRFRDGWFPDGRVTDFLDFRIWPVFNVADVAVVVGATVLAWVSVRHRREKDSPAPEREKDSRARD